jgi:hypothetical protein
MHVNNNSSLFIFNNLAERGGENKVQRTFNNMHGER